MQNKQEHAESKNYPWYKRVKDTAVIASGEITTGKKSKWLLLGGTAVFLALDWGPGNEWVIGAAGSTAHQAFDPTNVQEFIVASAATGAVAGVSSAAMQTTGGLLMSGSVRNFPKALNHWDKTRKTPVDTEAINNRGDIATGIMFGTAVAVVEKNLQIPERTFKDDARLSVGTSARIGVFNAGLVTGVSVATRVLENHGLEQQAQTLESVAQNPALYLAAFGVYKAIQYGKAKRKLKYLDATAIEE